MKRRGALVLAVGLLVTVVGATAYALTPPGGHDPGPYSACVDSKTGTVRMIDDGAVCSKKEYRIGWQNAVSQYSMPMTTEEVTAPGVTTWFKQVACPDGSWALGGGGASFPDGVFALGSSIPSNMEDETGNSHGWEVRFDSFDGQPHPGTFQAYVICAPATG
jgi:hypothetical protein